MATYTVNVKWGKELYKGITLDTSESPEVFKLQLFSLTNVEPERQKIMLKGSTLKDSWDAMKGLKNGAVLMLLGSATKLPEPPAEKTVFAEDLTAQELATITKRPAGLENMGNTCYMNATVQCLRSVKELKNALNSFRPASSMDMREKTTAITFGLKGLLGELDTTSETVTPVVFLQNMFMHFPQFAEKGEHGGYTQQDANECWLELVRCLQQKLPPIGQSNGSFIDQFMRVEFVQEMRCVECKEEEPVKMTETLYQLSCFIDKEVKYMQTGLQNRLKEHITKLSPTLGKDAQYEKTSQISRLPAYLSIQFVRFFYKEREAVNAKILKDVKFSLVLDMYELCTPELQKKMIPMREAMKEEDDRRLEALNLAKKSGGSLKVEKKMTKKPFSFEDDSGSNNSGFYELQAVLTHKGRSSSSGHYVGWVREKEDEWTMYDDDNVLTVKSEAILALSGGGDWHSAYVLLYGPKILEVEANEPEPEPAAEPEAKPAENTAEEVTKENMDTAEST